MLKSENSALFEFFSHFCDWNTYFISVGWHDVCDDFILCYQEGISSGINI